MNDLGMTTKVDAPFGVAKQRVTEALKAEGFGVLTVIDVAATLAHKLGENIEPYEILGACNPTLAHQALEAHRGIGLLLPCNVVLREVDGAVEVSVVNPEAMFSVVPAELQAELGPVVQDARDRLGRVVAALGALEPG